MNMYIVQVRESVNKREPIDKPYSLDFFPKKTEWREEKVFETIEEAKERAFELIKSHHKIADNVRVLKQVATFESTVMVKEK